MTLVDCAACGSKELVEKDGIIVCAYCQSKYFPQGKNLPSSGAVIGLAADIQTLLQKCRNDPSNSWRFANLILDIDPTNQEAKRFLS
jgi:hypothetical protein